MILFHYVKTQDNIYSKMHKSLELQRFRENQVSAFKTVYGYSNFPFSNINKGGHCLKLQKMARGRYKQVRISVTVSAHAHPNKLNMNTVT